MKDKRLRSKAAYVSTGRLPPDEQVKALVDEAHARFRTNDEGENASYYPALARVPRHLFGICVSGVNGAVYAAGDADYVFTIMSVAKPFTFALVCHAIGTDEVRAKIGLNATGLPFNSIMAVELHPQRLTNPMVNPGAIAAVSLAPGETAEAKWRFIHEGLSRFAGRPLALNSEIYASASASNHRNQALSRLMYDYGRLYFDPVETTDVYTRQSSLDRLPEAVGRITALDYANAWAEGLTQLFLSFGVAMLIGAIAVYLVMSRRSLASRDLAGPDAGAPKLSRSTSSASNSLNHPESSP